MFEEIDQELFSNKLDECKEEQGSLTLASLFKYMLMAHIDLDYEHRYTVVHQLKKHNDDLSNISVNAVINLLFD
jgi:hypothetical protein